MPASMAALSLAGSAVSAFGQYQQGQEQKSMYEYNAKLAEQEAATTRMMAKRETDVIRQNAVLNEYRQRKELAMNTGSQVGAYSASGVSVSTGSPLNVIADSIANQELEIQIGQWNAKNEISAVNYNAEIGASRSMNDAAMKRKYGENAATNAMFQAGSTLLTGATESGWKLGNEKIGTGGNSGKGLGATVNRQAYSKPAKFSYQKLSYPG